MVSFMAKSSTRPSTVADAAIQGDLRVLQDLLRAGATPLPDSLGQTPLTLAAIRGHVQAIALLAPLCDLEARSVHSGLTALEEALRHQRLECARALLLAGARLDAPSLAAFEALAVQAREAARVASQAKGLKTESKTRGAIQALAKRSPHKALGKASPASVNASSSAQAVAPVSQSVVSSAKNKKLTATNASLDAFGLLANAAKNGDAKAIRGLLPTIPADLAKRANRWGETPLILACRYADAKKAAPCVKLLLPFSDPLAQDHRGGNALIHAAARGAVEAVRLLAPISDHAARNELGETALIAAADAFDGTSEGRDRLDIVQILMLFSDLFAVDAMGDSAFHKAARRLDHLVLGALAVACPPGSSPTLANAQGLTPLLVLASCATPSPQSIAALLPVSDVSVCALDGKSAFELFFDRNKKWAASEAGKKAGKNNPNLVPPFVASADLVSQGLSVADIHRIAGKHFTRDRMPRTHAEIEAREMRAAMATTQRSADDLTVEKTTLNANAAQPVRRPSRNRL